MAVDRYATNAELLAVADRDGLSLTQLAEKTGLPRSTVGRRLQTARRARAAAEDAAAAVRREKDRDRKRASRAATSSAHEEAIRIARDVLQLPAAEVEAIAGSPSLGRMVMAETKGAVEQSCRDLLASPNPKPEDLQRLSDHVLDFVERGPWDADHAWWIDRRRLAQCETPIDVLTYYGRRPTHAPFGFGAQGRPVHVPALRSDALLSVAVEP